LIIKLFDITQLRKFPKTTLTNAYILLMQRASAISEPIMRDGLLQNVPVIQRILAEWQKQKI